MFGEKYARLFFRTVWNDCYHDSDGEPSKQSEHFETGESVYLRRASMLSETDQSE
jgi:hypothetical protein